MRSRRRRRAATAPACSPRPAATRSSSPRCCASATRRRGVPATVRDAVLGRAAQLGAAPMQVLQLVAIVPRQVELAARRRRARAGDRGRRGLPRERPARSPTARRCAFATSWRARAVEESILPPRALQLHARVLAALAARAPRRRRRWPGSAHHAQRAGDVDAVAALGAAGGARGRRCAARASEAAAHCRAALAHADRLDDAGARRRCSTTTRRTASSSTISTPRSRRATRRSSCSRARGDVARQAEALAAQALSLVRALRNADADATSRRAIALVESMPPGRHLAQAYATESYLRMLNRDLDDADPLGRRRRSRWPSASTTAPPSPAPTRRSARRSCSSTTSAAASMS